MLTAHTQQVQRLFDDRAAGWSAKYAVGEPLESRLTRFGATLVSLLPPPAMVLDLGCGTGNLARHLAASGYAVLAADISPAMLEVARRSGAPRSIEWVQLDPNAFSLPCRNASRDAIVMSSVLEYVDEPETVLRECARVLRLGGVLLCTVPDPAHPVRRAESVSRVLAKYSGSALRRICPPRLRAYLDYLRLSKNRFHLEHWSSLACRAGLESVALPAHDGHHTLTLLAFTRAAHEDATG